VAPRRVPGRPGKMTVRPGRHPCAMAKKAVKGKRIRRSPEYLAKLQPWVCPGCKNENEPQFDACWSCGAERPSS